MRTRILILLGCLLALCGHAADERVTLRVTITNLPVTGNNLSFSAPATKVITWSNTTSSAWVATNTTVNGCATNLFLQMAAYAPWTPRPALVWVNTNAFDILGEVNQAITVTNSGTWATLTLSTQTVTRLTTVRMPLSSEVGDTNRTNMASMIVKGITDYSTNAIGSNSVALTHALQIGLVTQRALGVKSFDYLIGTNGGIIYGGTNWGVAIQNATSIAGVMGSTTNGYNTNGVFDVPIFTNAVNYGNALSSRNASGGSGEQFGLGALASGIGVPTAVGASTEASGDTASAFAYLAVASGDRGLAAGTETEASGEDSTAVASFARATKPRTSSFGYNALAGQTNGTAIGAFAETDAEDQIKLGSDTVAYVKAHGRFTAGSITNGNFTGSNNFRGPVGWEEVTVSTLANGNNIAASATNKFIRLVASGPTAAFTINGIQGGWSGRELIIWNDTGQAMTFAHESGVDPTPANRIFSTSQGDYVFPTNAVAQLLYSAARSRWIYGAPNTNSVLANNSVTDGILRDSAALSVIGRSVNSSGDPADIAAGGSGLFLGTSNSIVTWIPAYLPAGAGVTNIQAYANSTTAIPFTANGFAASTTNIIQAKHPGGAIVANVDTNGFWLSKYDVVITNITTDGTITTLGSLTIPNNEVWRLETWVTAYSPGLTNVGGYHRTGVFTSTNSVARLVGSLVSTGGSGEDQSAWDYTIDTSGQTVRFRGTGASNQTNKWTIRVNIVPNVW